MTSSRPTLVPIHVLREAARERVASTSRRAFAAEAGISYGALTKFLAGSEPYSENLRKLTEWYLATAAEIDVEAAQSALGILVRNLPDDAQRRATTEILRVLGEHFAQRNVRVPSWFGELQ